ncbi:MAG: hypothetical protein J2P17_14975 [Mycobacterium sp.]|nr:hypothetical protein [Mycobacterium sp.]
MATTISKPGNAVYLEIGIWRAADGQIHIGGKDKALGLHTTVNNTPGSARYHANLYRHLDEILRANGV